MRLFLDASVIFTAAHNPAGRSAAIVDLARQGRSSLVSSQHAVAEARKNVAVKYAEALPRLDATLRHVALVPEATPADVTWAAEQGLPPKDAPILAAAVASGADVLVTGDRTHFGVLFGRRLRGVLVLNPADALARLLEKP
jgi:predicted nucleic acid-binding protein